MLNDEMNPAKSTQGYALASFDPDVIPRRASRKREQRRQPEEVQREIGTRQRAGAEQQRKNAAADDRAAPEDSRVRAVTDCRDREVMMACRAGRQEVLENENRQMTDEARQQDAGEDDNGRRRSEVVECGSCDQQNSGASGARLRDQVECGVR